MATENNLPAHSPLGASGAARWMACPGSVRMSEGLSDSESEHAALGTAAHALAAHCLTYGTQPWTKIGFGICEDEVIAPESISLADAEGESVHVINKDMADAVQDYVSNLVQLYGPLGDLRPDQVIVEERFHCPTIHDYFYGTADCVVLPDDGTVHVHDYKHGAGIVVDVVDNVQLMYYACGVLEDLDLWETADMVHLAIHQPRAWHPDGTFRTWSISVPDLGEWLEDTLIPAMDRALGDTTVGSGEHCRFCPARFRACPALVADMEELEQLMTKIKDDGENVREFTAEEMGRFMDLHDRAKVVRKAVEQVAFQKMERGDLVPGYKLVNARAFREWKDGAEEAAVEKFKKRAHETKLLSPAKIDKLPGGTEFSAEWAFKPEAGLRVVSTKDKRRAIETKSMGDTFKERRKK